MIRHIRLAVRLAALIASLALFGPASITQGQAQTPVDLQLVLAVDTSGSVDAREYKLQLSGIATALRDEEVMAAIRSGPNARIAVAVALWSDASHPKFATAWYVLSDRESVATLARHIQTLPRRRSGTTGIGKAIQFCVDLFEGSGLSSVRRVIDLSGDGAETAMREWSVSPRQARAYALDHDVTINGLAILTDDPLLDVYYRSEVVGGPGAFVLAVETLEDFASAMRRKLVREIQYQPKVSRLVE